MTGGAVEAVLFDLFGTLVAFDTSRLPEFAGARSTVPLLLPVLAREAPMVDPAAFARALQSVSRSWAATRSPAWRERPSRDRFRAALCDAGCVTERLDRAALALSRRHLRALADATVLPSAHAETLRTVAGSARVGIVTNFDDAGTAYEILGRHGLLAAVSSIVVSEAVGWRKPHPLPIEMALAELATDPARALFVGDTFDEDVVGAQAAGVRAVWIDTHGRGVPGGATPPAHVIRTLPELATLV